MSKNLIDKMVNRFLGWPLPKGFCPDCYISFDREKAEKNNGWPVGTNLLTADQARQMFEHVTADESMQPGPYSALPPHQQRVISEKEELDAKYRKLFAFIHGETFFTLCDEVERERMIRQLNAMLAYSEVLGERIAAFGLKS